MRNSSPGAFPPLPVCFFPSSFSSFFKKFIAINFLIRPAIYIWILFFFFFGFFYDSPSNKHHPPSRLPSYLSLFLRKRHCSYRNGTKIIREKMAENVVVQPWNKKKKRKIKPISCWLIICSTFIIFDPLHGVAAENKFRLIISQICPEWFDKNIWRDSTRVWVKVGRVSKTSNSFHNF